MTGTTVTGASIDKAHPTNMAFPVANEHGVQHGMTLRDYFAGQALAGYFAAPNTPHRNACGKDAAEYLYIMADAMMKARAQK